VTSEIYDGVSWLLGSVDRALRNMDGEGTDIALARLAEQDLSLGNLVVHEPRNLPACTYLPETIAASMLVADSVSAALAEVAPHLHWKQNINYSDDLLGAGYMDGYAYAEFIGPHGFFPGDDFLMGLLLLGPDRLYKDHLHPAPELYWTLTGPSLWRRGAGEFESRSAGSVIWHAPNVVHATRTGVDPLLALWIWTEDTIYPARLVTP
jgi:hypothetical protein